MGRAGACTKRVTDAAGELLAPSVSLSPLRSRRPVDVLLVHPDGGGLPAGRGRGSAHADGY